jgi:Trk-type K+ transport system membrane component
VSKVLICAVMIRGRHRGLPMAIDKAALLPSEISDTREDVPCLLYKAS